MEAYEYRVRRETHALIVAMAPCPAPELTDQTRLVTDLGYDSVRLIELMMALEQRFRLSQVEQALVDTVHTVGEVVELALELVGGRHDR